MIAGANNDHLPPTFTTRIAALKATLTGATDAANFPLLLAGAIDRSPFEYTAAEQTTFSAKLQPLVAQAAAAALASFEKHVDPALDLCKWRFIYDHRNAPRPLPTAPLRTQEDVINFFGCEASDAKMSLIGEYKSWLDMAPLLTKAQRNMGPAAFWSSPDMAALPTLSKIGRWWAEVITSSVAVERMFAIMRCMEDPRRNRMGEMAFEAEWRFRVNGWLIAEELNAALASAGAL
jgi:hypothetical protein